MFAFEFFFRGEKTRKLGVKMKKKKPFAEKGIMRKINLDRLHFIVMVLLRPHGS